jgi:hypothetical protein
MFFFGFSPLFSCIQSIVLPTNSSLSPLFISFSSGFVRAPRARTRLVSVMEPEEVAFALRRLRGRVRSRLASSIVTVLEAASKRSSPSQFSASLASLLASAPWWMTSLVLAAALWAAKGVIGSVTLTRRRRKLDYRRWRRRRPGVGGNGDEDEDANDLAAPRPASASKGGGGGGAGRYGLLDGNDDQGRSAGYEDDDASDPDDSATTLASHAREREEEEKTLPFPNPKNVAGLLLKQPSVASRGQQQQQKQK